MKGLIINQIVFIFTWQHWNTFSKNNNDLTDQHNTPTRRRTTQDTDGAEYKLQIWKNVVFVVSESEPVKEGLLDLGILVANDRPH